MKRVVTGNAALDRILGGGLPARSVNVIAGEPGAGKTLFALQLLFHAARQGKQCLYFTTLSEPALKLIGYMQHFSFFDARQIDSTIHLVDLGSILRQGDAEAALAAIADRVEALEPALVVIDSFKAMGELVGEQESARRFVYDLAVHMAGWGATSLLVGEYTEAEIATLPAFAVADGILALRMRRQDLTSVRELEVMKLRGSNPITGRHFFEISSEGVHFYPRVRGPDTEDPPFSIDQRVSTGVRPLDELLDGGLPRGTATVVHGGTGTGKTLLGLQFLLDGARRGEPGILFSLEETKNQHRAVCRTFGWDIDALEEQGLLTIVYASPVELSTDRFLDDAREMLESVGARRAVLDSLTSLSLGIVSERRFKELVYAMAKHFRAADVTTIMTMEIAELLGSGVLSGHGLSFASDNLIQLRYVEVEGRIERGISVLKARGVKHGTEMRRMMIGAGGIEVGPKYPSLRGVLTGALPPSGSGE